MKPKPRNLVSLLAVIAVIAASLLASNPRADAQGAQSVSGVMWFDENGDGIRQPNEPFAPGVSYRLVEFVDGEVIRVVADTVTASDGSYGADDLTPGVYGLSVTFAPGFVPGPLNQGNDTTIDNDFRQVVGRPNGVEASLNLSGGSTFPNFDLGFVPDDGPEISGIVWLDENRNGLQDAGEIPVENAVFQLLEIRAFGPVSIWQGATDADGTYMVDGLQPGDYAVVLTPPIGLQFGPTDVGDDDTIDNDFSAEGARGIAPFQIVPGETVSDLDAGLVEVETVGIGGRIWGDDDRDGTQDEGEPALANWPLELYTANGDVVTQVGQLVTDAAGRYDSGAIPAGRYTISVVPGANTSFTLQDVGDDATDSDVDADGVGPWVQFDGTTSVLIDAGLRLNIAADANCDGVLNILDAFATAQFVVGLREGLETCPVTTSTREINLGAVRVEPGEAVNIQSAFRVSQCVVGLTNALCPLVQAGDNEQAFVLSN